MNKNKEMIRLNIELKQIKRVSITNILDFCGTHRRIIRVENVNDKGDMEVNEITLRSENKDSLELNLNLDD